MARPRWILHVQAQVWRFLMSIGMRLHQFARPRPPKPTFQRRIKSTISGIPGSFNLSFYTPREYDVQRKAGFHHRRGLSGHTRGFPVVINFHGGGFVLGTARDDARWCATVVEECNALVISVDYRLGPECPFPTAVEDGTDAVLWVHKHAEELGIDPDRIALSGFSSGANMAITVPLRLYDHQSGFSRAVSREPSRDDLHADANPHGEIQIASSSSSSTLHPPRGSDHEMNDLSAPGKKAPQTTVQSNTASVCAVVSWYPSLDYTKTREQRRATNVRTDQNLPALFTNLFDDSYLHPPDTIPLDSPYLSPGIAPAALLRAGLPHEIFLFTCEWDMLLKEGQDFYERLVAPDVRKHVVYRMVEGVPHGWDKAPNPIKPTPGVRDHYLSACTELRRVFGSPPGTGSAPGEIHSSRKDSLAIVR